MSVIPVIRHLIAGKKEPTMNGADPTAHDIMYAVRPKGTIAYPVWLPTFFMFVMITDGQGTCEFQVEVKLVGLDEVLSEVETLVGRSKVGVSDLGNRPLSVRVLSIQVPPVLLPKKGVYRIYLICDGQPIGAETIHAR